MVYTYRALQQCNDDQFAHKMSFLITLRLDISTCQYLKNPPNPSINIELKSPAPPPPIWPGQAVISVLFAVEFR